MRKEENKSDERIRKYKAGTQTIYKVALFEADLFPSYGMFCSKREEQCSFEK